MEAGGLHPPYILPLDILFLRHTSGQIYIRLLHHFRLQEDRICGHQSVTETPEQPAVTIYHLEWRILEKNQAEYLHHHQIEEEDAVADELGKGWITTSLTTKEMII